jgi:hypothetical protein
MEVFLRGGSSKKFSPFTLRPSGEALPYSKSCAFFFSFRQFKQGSLSTDVFVFSSGKRVDLGCYLEDYRVRIDTWAGRYSWRGEPRRGEANRTTGDSLVLTVLSSMVLAVLLIVGGNEQNPGPVEEVENTMRLICTGCSRNKMSGIQCELCGRWYHYSFGNVKALADERENWNCDKCRTEK